MTYYFIDDNVSPLGGAELTLQAIKNYKPGSIISINTRDICTHNVDPNGIYVLGNLATFDIHVARALYRLMDKAKFVKIEFDYGYCIARGPIPHTYFYQKECDCGSITNNVIGQMYTIIRKNASHLFYMSKAQMDIHNKQLTIANPNQTVLSSCFDRLTISTLRPALSYTKNGRYLIIDGRPGWHRIAKGVDTSIKYAIDHGLDYDVKSTSNHQDMMKLMNSYYGLIFLPYIEDTCPRVTIEAKLAGCNVITSEKAQHTTEEWWSKPLNEVYDYIENRPKIFWQVMESI